MRSAMQKTKKPPEIPLRLRLAPSTRGRRFDCAQDDAGGGAVAMDDDGKKKRSIAAKLGGLRYSKYEGRAVVRSCSSYCNTNFDESQQKQGGF